MCALAAASGRVALQPWRQALFSIIAIPFDAFQTLPCAKSRWLLACLARYTNRAGEAWPSMRQLAIDAAISLASVSRGTVAKLGVRRPPPLAGVGRWPAGISAR